MAARPEDGGFIREDAAFEVFVKCARCGQPTKTWITPKNHVAPTTLCDYCRWVVDQDQSPGP